MACDLSEKEREKVREKEEKEELSLSLSLSECHREFFSPTKRDDYRWPSEPHGTTRLSSGKGKYLEGSLA